LVLFVLSKIVYVGQYSESTLRVKLVEHCILCFLLRLFQHSNLNKYLYWTALIYFVLSGTNSMYFSRQYFYSTVLYTVYRTRYTVYIYCTQYTVFGYYTLSTILRCFLYCTVYCTQYTVFVIVRCFCSQYSTPVYGWKGWN